MRCLRSSRSYGKRWLGSSNISDAFFVLCFTACENLTFYIGVDFDILENLGIWSCWLYKGNEKEDLTTVTKPKSKSYDEGGDKEPPSTVTAETKAAEILQRLKSSFKIYKPQGTFLWPNMVTYSLSGDLNVVQLQTLLLASYSNLSPVPNLRLRLCETQSESYSVSPIKPVPLRFATLME